MSTLVNIVVTVLLIMWASALMMSPMMIAAQGMRDSRGSVLMAMAILGYPIVIFIIVKAIGLRYFGMNVNGWLIAVTLIWIAVISLYGLPRMLFNIGKGIPNNGYFTRNDAVYLDGKQISGADVPSFQVLDDQRYAHDKAAVYYYGQRIPDAHPASFKPVIYPGDSTQNITTAFWRDDTRVYYNGQVMKDSDAPSFELLENMYARDSHHVYFTDRVLPDADPRAFRLLGDGVGTDGKAIFVAMKRSKTPVDINSFTIVDGDYGRDKDNIYMIFIRADEPLVKAEGVDPETFEILERSYAKDKNHAYFFGNYQDKGQRFIRLEGVNPATFTIGYDAKTKAEAHDGNRHYLYGELVKP